jgi:hypothetical protein
MVIAAADVQVPVCGWFVAVHVRVAVHAARRKGRQRCGAQYDQQHASGHFSAAIHDGGDRPAEHDERARAEREQQRMAGGKPHRYPNRAGALRGWRAIPGRHRQRRDRHQVIGPESMEEAEQECGRHQDQDVTCPMMT